MSQLSYSRQLGYLTNHLYAAIRFGGQTLPATVLNTWGAGTVHRAASHRGTAAPSNQVVGCESALNQPTYTRAAWAIVVHARSRSTGAWARLAVISTRSGGLRAPPILALLLFSWVTVGDQRPGRGGRRPPRVRSAMAMSASGLA